MPYADGQLLMVELSFVESPTRMRFWVDGVLQQWCISDIPRDVQFAVYFRCNRAQATIHSVERGFNTLAIGEKVELFEWNRDKK